MIHPSPLVFAVLCAAACATAKPASVAPTPDLPRPLAGEVAWRVSAAMTVAREAAAERSPTSLAAIGTATGAATAPLVPPIVLFGFDSTTLEPDARASLDAFAQRYLGGEAGRTLVIEGHADDRGTEEYNLVLSSRRADAVRRYLAALGVDAPKLEVRAYGENRPAEPGAGESAWAQNRRAVVVAGPAGGR